MPCLCARSDTQALGTVILGISLHNPLYTKHTWDKGTFLVDLGGRCSCSTSPSSHRYATICTTAPRMLLSAVTIAVNNVKCSTTLYTIDVKETVPWNEGAIGSLYPSLGLSAPYAYTLAPTQTSSVWARTPRILPGGGYVLLRWERGYAVLWCGGSPLLTSPLSSCLILIRSLHKVKKKKKQLCEAFLIRI